MAITDKNDPQPVQQTQAPRKKTWREETTSYNSVQDIIDRGKKDAEAFQLQQMQNQQLGYIQMNRGYPGCFPAENTLASISLLNPTGLLHPMYQQQPMMQQMPMQQPGMYPQQPMMQQPGMYPQQPMMQHPGFGHPMQQMPMQQPGVHSQQPMMQQGMQPQQPPQMVQNRGPVKPIVAKVHEDKDFFGYARIKQGEEMAVPVDAVRHPDDALSKSPYAHTEAPIPEKEDLEERTRAENKRLQEQFEKLDMHSARFKDPKQRHIASEMEENNRILDELANEKFREFEEEQKKLLELSCSFIMIDNSFHNVSKRNYSDNYGYSHLTEYINNTHDVIYVQDSNNFIVPVHPEPIGNGEENLNRKRYGELRIRDTYTFKSYMSLKDIGDLIFKYTNRSNLIKYDQREAIDIYDAIRRMLQESPRSHVSFEQTVFNIVVERKVMIGHIQRNPRLFISTHNIILTTRKEVAGIPHPYSYDGFRLAEKGVGGVYDSINHISDSYSAGMVLIDNEGKFKNRWFYNLGRVHELTPVVNHRYPSGLYVNCFINGERDNENSTYYEPIEEELIKAHVFRTKEEAESHGNPEAHLKAMEYSSKAQKMTHEKFKGDMELQTMLQKAELEAESAERKREQAREEHAFKLESAKLEYKEKRWKLAAACLTAIAAIAAVWHKYQSQASSGGNGFAFM